MKRNIKHLFAILLLTVGCNNTSYVEDDIKSEKNSATIEETVNPMDGLNEKLCTSEEEVKACLKDYHPGICGILWRSCKIESEYGTSHYFLFLTDLYKIAPDSKPAQYYEVPACGGTFKAIDMGKSYVFGDKVSDWYPTIQYWGHLIGDNDLYPKDEEVKYFNISELTAVQEKELVTLGTMDDENGNKDVIGIFSVPRNTTGKDRYCNIVFRYYEPSPFPPDRVYMDDFIDPFYITIKQVAD